MSGSTHQGHELAAAGNFEFLENRIEMLFHHRQTQACRIGDFLVAPAIADQSRNFLFARGEPDEMRQTGVRRLGRLPSRTACVFALDQKMWPRQVGWAELF